MFILHFINVEPIFHSPCTQTPIFKPLKILFNVKFLSINYVHVYIRNDSNINRLIFLIFIFYSCLGIYDDNQKLFYFKLLLWHQYSCIWRESRDCLPSVGYEYSFFSMVIAAIHISRKKFIFQYFSVKFQVSISILIDEIY